MNLLRHWVVVRNPGEHDERRQVITDESALYRYEGYRNVTIEGPFVPASQLEGAVAALRRIAAIEVEHTIIQTPAEARLKNAVAIAKSALSNSGGQ